ncbi:MAG: RsbRD N-terminal domain-containing protein [Desulfomonilaceae bacterium]
MPACRALDMLKEILKSKRSEILKSWSQFIRDTYPPETSRFLQSQPDEFANPVGAAIGRVTDQLFDLLVEKDLPWEEAARILDDLVRLRAVQDFSPSHAVGFIFLVKRAVRNAALGELQDKELWADLLAFESKVDNLALTAFDLYMKCREKIYELRATEIRNRTSRILERACQKYGMPHEW